MVICKQHKRYKAFHRPNRDCIDCWNGYFAHSPRRINEVKYLINTHGIERIEALTGPLLLKHFSRVINSVEQPAAQEKVYVFDESEE